MPQFNPLLMAHPYPFHLCLAKKENGRSVDIVEGLEDQFNSSAAKIAFLKSYKQALLDRGFSEDMINIEIDA